MLPYRASLGYLYAESVTTHTIQDRREGRATSEGLTLRSRKMMHSQIEPDHQILLIQALVVKEL